MDDTAMKELFNAIKRMNAGKKDITYESPEIEGTRLKKVSLLKDVPMEYTFDTISCAKT